MPFRRSKVRMIRLSSHWLVPAGRQSKNSLLRTYCSSQPATLLFHAGQHADRRLYRFPLPVSTNGMLASGYSCSGGLPAPASDSTIESSDPSTAGMA